MSINNKPPLDIEEFKLALPSSMRKNINTTVFEAINKKIQNPEMYEEYRDNLISFSSVLNKGRFKIESYVNAIKYVSHKIKGRSNKDSYFLTFPEKRIEWLGTVSIADQDTYISAYNRGKLVSLITEQTLTPLWIVNQDIYQKAINKQAALMMNDDVSFKVQSDAANSLLTHLKQPEASKIELDIGIKKDSVIDLLRQSTLAMVEQQRQMIKDGSQSVKDITDSVIEHRVEPE